MVPPHQYYRPSLPAAAKELGLPPARPLGEMLTRVENGKLFEGEDVPI